MPSPYLKVHLFINPLLLTSSLHKMLIKFKITFHRPHSLEKLEKILFQNQQSFDCLYVLDLSFSMAITFQINQ